MPTNDQIALLKTQIEDLCDWIAQYLKAVFPSLDKTAIQKAKTKAIARYHWQIDMPLLPIYRRPFTQQQLTQIKANWASAYIQWLSIWQAYRDRSLVLRASTEGLDADYGFVLACLASLPQVIWPMVDRPEYVQDAQGLLARQQSEQAKDRMLARQQGRVSLARMGRHMEDLGQWCFVFSCLLESGLPQPPDQTGAKGGQ